MPTQNFISVSEHEEPADVRVVPRGKECLQSPTHGGVLIRWPHPRVVLEAPRNEEEEIVSLLADMALPEVEEVHVVPHRLPAFDLKDDPGLSERHVVVGSDGAFVRGE